MAAYCRVSTDNEEQLSSYENQLRYYKDYIERAIYRKQWKMVRTRYRMIKKFGIPEWKVREMANCRKGARRAAIMPNSVLTKEIIAGLGYISMTDYYLKMREN